MITAHIILEGSRLERKRWQREVLEILPPDAGITVKEKSQTTVLSIVMRKDSGAIAISRLNQRGYNMQKVSDA